MILLAREYMEKIIYAIVIGNYDGIDNNHNDRNIIGTLTIIAHANIVIVTSLNLRSFHINWNF